MQTNCDYRGFTCSNILSDSVSLDQTYLQHCDEIYNHSDEFLMYLKMDLTSDVPTVIRYISDLFDLYQSQIQKFVESFIVKSTNDFVFEDSIEDLSQTQDYYTDMVRFRSNVCKNFKLLMKEMDFINRFISSAKGENSHIQNFFLKQMSIIVQKIRNQANEYKTKQQTMSKAYADACDAQTEMKEDTKRKQATTATVEVETEEEEEEEKENTIEPPSKKSKTKPDLNYLFSNNVDTV